MAEVRLFSSVWSLDRLGRREDLGTIQQRASSVLFCGLSSAHRHRHPGRGLTAGLLVLGYTACKRILIVRSLTLKCLQPYGLMFYDICSGGGGCLRSLYLSMQRLLVRLWKLWTTAAVRFRDRCSCLDCDFKTRKHEPSCPHGKE